MELETEIERFKTENAALSCLRKENEEIREKLRCVIHYIYYYILYMKAMLTQFFNNLKKEYGEKPKLALFNKGSRTAKTCPIVLLWRQVTEAHSSSHTRFKV